MYSSKYAGQMMFGVKDIKLRRYGSTMYHDVEASLLNGEKAVMGIMYNNITSAFKPATLIIAGFRDEIMSYCEVKEYTIYPGNNGFKFDIEASADVADYYKIFLLDGVENIKPLKDEDKINIKID